MGCASALLTLLLLLASANTATAALIAEAAEIPYQINHSDRIIIGTVTDIQPFYDHTIVTICVDEWLMNPLSTKTITIRTDIGTNVCAEDEPGFTLNETVILMLEDMDLDGNRFKVVFGEPGKHPIPDKDEILIELESGKEFHSPDDSEDEMIEYPPNPVEFAAEGVDYGYDLDEDGLYDYLVVEVNARTSEPGVYYLTGDLFMPLGSSPSENGMTGIGFQMIGVSGTAVYLNETFRHLTLNFEGGSIRKKQMDGRYEMKIHVSNGSWGFCDDYDHVTAEYYYSDFEMPDVLLSGPVRARNDAIELARMKASEIGVEIGNMKEIEIFSKRGQEIWHISFEGENFTERFVVRGNTTGDVKHWTMNSIPINGCFDKQVISVAGILVVLLALLGAVLLAR